MRQDTNSFKIVYNSDLIIRDRSEAATLCVFYDKVCLPFTSEASSRSLTAASGKKETHDYRREIKNWEIEYGTLFDAGVLARMPPFVDYEEWVSVERVDLYEKPRGEGLPEDITLSCIDFGEFAWRTFAPPHPAATWREPEEGDKILDTQMESGLVFSATISKTIQCKIKRVVVERKITHKRERDLVVQPDKLESILSMPVYKHLDTGDTRLIRDDLVKHLLRTDIDMPQVFATLKGRPGRDVLVALEAEATFSYLLPKLHVYHPTQILELRDKISDTREGFTMHLWKLSKGLEERAREDASVKEIAGFAKDLIETELIPDYREFRRQLDAMGARRWDKVLDSVGKIAEIDATPWTPKFWGLLLKALGVTIITSAAEQEEMLSNKYQAFKFMSELETTALRRQA